METKIKFQLRKPTATSETLISLVYRFNNQKLVYSTGESIHPNDWDKTAGKPLSPRKHKSIIIQLDRYKTKLMEILSDFQISKKPITVGTLRHEMDIEFKKDVPDNAKTDMLSWIDNFVKTVQYTRATPPKPIHERTRAKYKTTYNILVDFIQSERKGKFDWHNVDMDFYFDFTSYLKRNRNHAPNTIGKHIKSLKVILREAAESGIQVSQTFENRKFAAPQQRVEHVYLTEDELIKIYECDLSKRPGLEAVRDLFVIGCYTGLRFSDFTTITPENIIKIDSGRAIKKATFKTKEVVLIPLHWRVETILSKYDNHLPRAISNQKMNDALKIIGQKAEITSDFTTDKTRGDMTYSETKKKWQLISTHTARRSFATNAFKAGIPSISIMKITGHRTETAFLKYINLSNEENANLLMNHSFFTKGKMKVV